MVPNKADLYDVVHDVMNTLIGHTFFDISLNLWNINQSYISDSVLNCVILLILHLYITPSKKSKIKHKKHINTTEKDVTIVSFAYLIV